MKPLRIALCVLIVGTAFAVFGGGDWRAACLGGLFGLLLAAMNETMPLIDWLYPKDENHKPDPDD